MGRTSYAVKELFYTLQGEGAHTGHEQLYVSSIVPRARLLYRLMETLS